MLAIDDIKNARAELAENLSNYLSEKKEKIDGVSREVQKSGAVDAVTDTAKIENALTATRSEGLFLEATVRADDKAPINFLELGRRASLAVCRIVDSNRVALGTGFLIGPGILITNEHVLPNASEAIGGWAEFDYEEDADERALNVQRFALQPEQLYISSPRDKMDFAILAVAPVGREGGELQSRGWLPLDERRNKIFEGQPVVIIQHPDGQLKQICLFDSVLTFRDNEGPYILYTTDTADGTSGSPCFNRFWQTIALHHASLDTDDRDDNGRPVAINRGIRISSIMSALKTGVDVSDAASAHKVYGLLTDPTVQKQGRPFAAFGTGSSASTTAAAAEMPTNNSASLNLEGRTVIRVREPADFLDQRKGYKNNFLGAGFKVPLPVMPDWLEADAARLITNPQKSEIKYQHFSLVMSKSRKLAIFTATNVDGSTLENLGRKDRDPDSPLGGVNPEAAADRWFYDPRIEQQHQLGPELYDQTDFDYGHLVRRLDPVWGPDGATKRIANDDTFYMTNCAPHEVRFHRTRKGTDISWSKLENLVLDAAKESKLKFSVFTGPVLDPRDPLVGGIKIPTAFWKIATFVKDGKLKAYGYLLWQDDEVRTMEGPQFEGLEKLEKEEPTPIREIARITGLDFGSLFAADVTLVN